MPITTDPWTEYCRRLNRFYRLGELKILVGAGLSRSANLPGWEDLNKGLLRKYIERDIQDDKTANQAHLDALVKDLYTALGKDEAADFVWNAAAPEMFFDDLAEVLYTEKDRQFCDLKLSIAHRQLAAMELAELFTMNFDPLLELAVQQHGKGKDERLDPRLYRRTSLSTELPAERPVYHLHGWVDPDGFRGGEFVLTEAHYFELFTRRGERPNLLLEHVLTSGGAVLILGMSMTDTNLRRQLYLRSRNQLCDPTEIYAVMKSEGQNLISGYQIAHWSSRGVRLVPIADYDDIPNLLRQVKFGPSEDSKPLSWIDQSLKWVQERLPKERLFSDAWQAGAHQALLSLKAEIERFFNVPPDDPLTLSFLLPMSREVLGIVADTRQARTGAQAKDLVDKFSLRIERSKPQGVSGVAFSQGKPFAVENNTEAADRNFTPGMKQYYINKGLRDWRSLTAIPVLDTPDFLPVAVVSVGSMSAEPFWKKLGHKGEPPIEEFHTALRKGAQSLLTSPR